MGPNWIEKFLSFDELIGASLTRITYFVGLIIIIGWAVLRMIGALGYLFADFFYAVGTLIAAPLQAVFAILIWRLVAEVAFIFFRDHGDVPATEPDAEKPYTEGFTIDADETEAAGN
ncbi:MAG: DUF4282 domain-containing protein [Pseudomonadota bacterium]